MDTIINISGSTLQHINYIANRSVCQAYKQVIPTDDSFTQRKIKGDRISKGLTLSNHHWDSVNDVLIHGSASHVSTTQLSPHLTERYVKTVNDSSHRGWTERNMNNTTISTKYHQRAANLLQKFCKVRIPMQILVNLGLCIKYWANCVGSKPRSNLYRQATK